MKIEHEKPKFAPVTIKLETQEEVDILHAILAIAPGGHANSMLFKLYAGLGMISDSEFSDYWTRTGSFTVKK